MGINPNTEGPACLDTSEFQRTVLIGLFFSGTHVILVSVVFFLILGVGVCL